MMNVDFRRLYEVVTRTDTSNAAFTNRGQSEIRVRCPFHDDDRPSLDLHLEKQVFICRSLGCGVGGNPVELVRRTLFNDLPKKQGFGKAYGYIDSFNPGVNVELKPMPRCSSSSSTLRTVVGQGERSIYTYVDEFGVPVHDVIRIDGKDESGKKAKDIIQRMRLPAGEWIATSEGYRYRLNATKAFLTNADGTIVELSRTYKDGSERVAPHGQYLYGLRDLGEGAYRNLPYNLPKVIATAAAGGRIFLAEGEKKTQALIDRTGLCATTIRSGPLLQEWLPFFGGATQLVILTDSDAPGRTAAIQRATFFRQAIWDIRIVDFFGDDSKRDVDDWLAERPFKYPEQLIAELDALVASAALLGEVV